MSKNKDIGAFGDPSYLVKKFDDISIAVRSEKSKAAKEIKAFVKSKATAKDNMYCYEVVMTKGQFDGKPCSCVIAHVTVGLNGPGKNSDYLAAIKRLTDSGRFKLIDAWIDAVDDLWDFLFSVK